MSGGDPQIRRRRVSDWVADGQLRLGGRRSREELAFVATQLAIQVILGDGLLAFRRHANGVLDPARLLEVLEAGKAVRPDLARPGPPRCGSLPIWAGVEEAIAVAEEATRRFPMVPSSWYDLGFLQHRRGDTEAAKAALRHTLEIAPHFTAAQQQLAWYCEQEQDYAAARAILERAVVHAPLERDLHCQLAEILWHLNEKDAAIASVTRAILIEPDFDDGWARLQAWARDLQRPDMPGELAEQLSVNRPGNAACWLALVKALSGAEHLLARMAAVDKAIALQPGLVGALDLRAVCWPKRATSTGPSKRAEILSTGKRSAALRARAAEFESRRGNMPAAVTEMSTALARTPRSRLVGP